MEELGDALWAELRAWSPFISLSLSCEPWEVIQEERRSTMDCKNCIFHGGDSGACWLAVGQVMADRDTTLSEAIMSCKAGDDICPLIRRKNDGNNEKRED